jgi:hypothetical protein
MASCEKEKKKKEKKFKSTKEAKSIHVDQVGPGRGEQLPSSMPQNYMHLMLW